MATITKTTLAPTITAANLETALDTALQNAGMGTAIDTYTSGSESRRVYQKTFNADTFGTLFFELRINTTTRLISTAHYTAFDTAANTGSNVIVSSNNPTPTTATAIDFWAYDADDEAALLLFRQGGAGAIWSIGWFRPATKPVWWSENTYPFYFVIRSIAASPLTGMTNGTSALSPFTQNNYIFEVDNIDGQLPDLSWEVRQPIAMGNSGASRGFCGEFSTVFATADTSGLTPDDDFDFNSGTRIFRPVSFTTGGIVIEET